MSGRDQRSVGISLYVLALFTVLHTLSLTDRFLIAAFGTQISVDLGLSNQQFGLVTGLAFTLFYASTGPVAGLLVDRFGPGRLLGVGVLIWSAMTALTGMAKSFLGLWLPRVSGGRGSHFDPCDLEDSEYPIRGPPQRDRIWSVFYGWSPWRRARLPIGGRSAIWWRDSDLARCVFSAGCAGVLPRTLGLAFNTLARSHSVAVESE